MISVISPEKLAAAVRSDVGHTGINVNSPAMCCSGSEKSFRGQSQIVPGSYLFMSEDEVTPQNDQTKLD